MNKWFIIFLLLTSIFITSCSKDEDNFRPTITVSSPTHMQNINGLDTIVVRATFKDDQNLEEIQVYLKDENDNLVLSSSSINIQPNTSTYELNELFFFDDIHLLTGSYYFIFKASDGKNTALVTVDVVLDEYPKQRNGIFIADNNGSSSNLTLLDNSFNGSFYSTYAGSFFDFEVNSFEQQMLITPSNTSNITAVNLETGSVEWTDNISSTVTGILGSDNYYYLGYYNGNIKRYNNNGAFNFHGVTNTNHYVEQIAIHENHIIMEQKEIGTSNVQLTIDWLSNGSTVNQATINEDILGIYTIDPNNLAILTNNSIPEGNLIYYYYSTGLTGSPFTLNIGNIDACEEISTGLYLVAESGNLTLINAAGFSKLTYLNGITANLLKYDHLTDELFVVNGNQLTIYDYSLKSVKGSYTHSSAIIDLDFWYNK